MMYLKAYGTTVIPDDGRYVVLVGNSGCYLSDGLEILDRAWRLDRIDL